MRRAIDSLTLSLAGGEVEIRLGLSVIAAWLEVGVDDVRTLLLSVAGAAAMGHHAVLPPSPVVPSEDRAEDEEPAPPVDDGSQELVGFFRRIARG